MNDAVFRMLDKCRSGINGPDTSISVDIVLEISGGFRNTVTLRNKDRTFLLLNARRLSECRTLDISSQLVLLAENNINASLFTKIIINTIRYYVKYCNYNYILTLNKSVRGDGDEFFIGVDTDQVQVA